jgi:hypothetical protein
MLGASDHAGWVFRSNHLDGRTRNIQNAFSAKVFGGYNTVTVQGYGGAYLYNDGHVDWKRFDQVMIEYVNTEVGTTYLAF